MKRTTEMLTAFLLGGILVFLGRQALATPTAIIYVAPDCSGLSGCYTSPQAAANAAPTGAEIHITAGTYNDLHAISAPEDYANTPLSGNITQVLYLDRAVTVIGGYNADFSKWDPSRYTTTLDAGGRGRAVMIAARNVTLKSLVLHHGEANGLGGITGYDAGGALLINAPEVKVSRCVLENSHAERGGGIALSSIAQADLQSNVLRHNQAERGGGLIITSQAPHTLVTNIWQHNAANYGGGCYGENQDLTLIANTFYSNTANFGGGVALLQSAITLTSNQFRENYAQNYGGGCYFVEGHSLKGRTNRFEANVAQDHGGGIYLLHDEAVTLSEEVFNGNAAFGYGGAVYLWKVPLAQLDNEATMHNHAHNGSAYYVQASNVRGRHLTLAQNEGTTGFYVTSATGVTSTVWLTNTLCVSHTTAFLVGTDSDLIIDGILWSGNDTNIGGSGSSSTAHTVTGSPKLADDLYHLQPDSAAVNAGIVTTLHTDVDRQPRSYQQPDLGADEYWPLEALHPIYLPLIMR